MADEDLLDEARAADATSSSGPGKSDRDDMDETRRLLYMSLVAGRTKRYNLAGTLVNALKHHQGVDTPVDELLDRAVDAVEGHDTGWARAEIDRITALLGD